jgi:YVTN family beta-propeller protein
MGTQAIRIRRSKTRLALRIVAVLAAMVLNGQEAAGATIDSPAGGSIVARIPVQTPRDVTAGFGSIWVANGPEDTVTRLDPATNDVEAIVPVPDPASVLAAGSGAIWLTSLPGNTVTRIDPSTNAATGTTSLAPSGLGPIGVTVFGGFVWVANHDGDPTGSVAKIDPATLAVVDVIPIGNEPIAGPNWLSSGAGSVWTDVPNLRAVVRIDPVSDAITATIPDKGVCGALAASDTAVWVAGGSGPAVSRASRASTLPPTASSTRSTLAARRIRSR